MKKLFVSSLPIKCTSADLKSYFKTLIGEKAFTLKKSKNKGKRTNGHAILTTKTEEAYQIVISTPHVLMGQTLSISEFQDKQARQGVIKKRMEKRVYVDGLPSGTTETDAKLLFRSFGTIINVFLKERQFVESNEQTITKVLCFLDFEQLSQAKDCFTNGPRQHKNCSLILTMGEKYAESLSLKSKSGCGISLKPHSEEGNHKRSNPSTLSTMNQLSRQKIEKKAPSLLKELRKSPDSDKKAQTRRFIFASTGTRSLEVDVEPDLAEKMARLSSSQLTSFPDYTPPTRYGYHSLVERFKKSQIASNNLHKANYIEIKRSADRADQIEQSVTDPHLNLFQRQLILSHRLPSIQEEDSPGENSGSSDSKKPPKKSFSILTWSVREKQANIRSGLVEDSEREENLKINYP